MDWVRGWLQSSLKEKMIIEIFLFVGMRTIHFRFIRNYFKSFFFKYITNISFSLLLYILCLIFFIKFYVSKLKLNIRLICNLSLVAKFNHIELETFLISKRGIKMT